MAPPNKRKADDAKVDAKKLKKDPAPSTGERFGGSTELLPLEQLSQVIGADEDDDEAANVALEAQNGESVSEKMLYGTQSPL